MTTQEAITLGGGCFWCIEAVFQAFKGVTGVVSGYAGGSVDKPSYDQVSTGRTGHAEVVQVTFDPKVISLEKILTIFFHAHDPTTLNRQGNDSGPQYRSVVFYASEQQHSVAEAIKAEIAKTGVWGSAPIVTEIQPLKTFFRAEDYHQNYFEQNSNQPYCSFVIAPKLKKIRAEFRELLR
ncbi:MAG: peptide-methionine (S)-S-oxide reductase MsrA [Oligoflexia bacterium]|nr:peptide-methionine (S)-S-oxide reductase MsrA [Oligoflexia bacterium]